MDGETWINHDESTAMDKSKRSIEKSAQFPKRCVTNHPGAKVRNAAMLRHMEGDRQEPHLWAKAAFSFLAKKFWTLSYYTDCVNPNPLHRKS